MVAVLCVAGCSDAPDAPRSAPRPTYSPPLPPNALAVLTARQQAVNDAPSDAKAWLALGQTYLADSHDEAAADCFEDAAALSPGDGAAWMFLAMAREEAGDPVAAAAAYAAASEADHVPPAALWRAALLQVDQGAPEAAVDLANAALRINAGSVMARLVLARALLDLDRPRDAAGALNSVIKSSPDNRYARLLFGRALQRAGLQGAAAHLRLGQGAEPVWHDPWTTAALTHGLSVDTRRTVAEGLLQQGQFGRAAEILAQLHTEVPDQVGIEVSLAKALRSAGQLDEAIAITDRLLQQNPDEHPAHTQAAGVRFAKWQATQAPADLAAALEHLDAAIALTETDGQNWMLRGEVRRRAGDLKGAASDYSRAAEVMPHKPGLTLQAAALFLQVDEPARAIELLDALKSDFPEDINLLVLSGQARQMAGDLDGALRAAGEAAALAPHNPKVKELMNALAQPSHPSD